MLLSRLDFISDVGSMGLVGGLAGCLTLCQCGIVNQWWEGCNVTVMDGRWPGALPCRVVPRAYRC